MSQRYKGGVISATPPTVNAETFGSAKGVWTLQQQLQYEGSGTWPSPFTPVYVEDVFSTYLYTGTGSAQTITNGIDLSGKGGLVWTKSRSTGENNGVSDTSNGVNKAATTNGTSSFGTTGHVTAFNSNGFTLGTSVWGNSSGTTYVSWSFQKQPKFFDVVTYTGNGSARTIAHNLGSTPGFLIIKRTDSTGGWIAWHRSAAPSNPGYHAYLNTTDDFFTAPTDALNYTNPTSTVFSVGTSAASNANGGTYVAYLFAHNAGGFGANGTDNVISCDSFTSSTSTDVNVNLGYEAQFVLVKLADTAGGWYLLDTMRAMPVATSRRVLTLLSNSSIAENDVDFTGFFPNSSGFTVTTSFSSSIFGANQKCIYIAIRRGPMKTPTDATKVFDVDTYTGDNGVSRLISSGFAADFAWVRDRNDGTAAYRDNFVQDRMRGGGLSLVTNSTANEGSDTGWNNTDMVNEFRSNTGILVTVNASRYNATGKSYVAYQFARARGFFDVVCYTAQSGVGTVSHGLGVAPELMIIKARPASLSGTDWAAYAAPVGATKRLFFNGVAAATTTSLYWNDTAPTSTQFTIGSSADVNSSGGTYVAYLFASVSGVSKIGSYTGTGTTLQINCGFTSGSRFVMIKRTDSTGSWYIWDSARGIVAGDDPYIMANNNDTEVTNTDYVDTYSLGFEISSTAPAEINANGGSYIYLAIA